jgi:hypothetical protein
VRKFRNSLIVVVVLIPILWPLCNYVGEGAQHDALKALQQAAFLSAGFVYFGWAAISWAARDRRVSRVQSARYIENYRQARRARDENLMVFWLVQNGLHEDRARVMAKNDIKRDDALEQDRFEALVRNRQEKA